AAGRKGHPKGRARKRQCRRGGRGERTYLLNYMRTAGADSAFSGLFCSVLIGKPLDQFRVERAMKRSKLIAVGTMLSAIALAGTPAFADKEGSRGSRGAQGSERARERSENHGVVEGRAVERVAPRDAGPRDVGPRDVSPRDVSPRYGARDQRWD